jgi:hypothetical protein
VPLLARPRGRGRARPAGRWPAPARAERQVNEEWLDVYREWVYGAGYGVQLGAAVLTQVATAAVWVMLLAAALTGSLLGGALVGLVFGAVRAVPLALTRRGAHARCLRLLHVRVATWERPAHHATVGALAATGVLIASTLLVTAGPASEAPREVRPRRHRRDAPARLGGLPLPPGRAPDDRRRAGDPAGRPGEALTSLAPGCHDAPGAAHGELPAAARPRVTTAAVRST